jgi:hypothetical protein
MRRPANPRGVAELLAAAAISAAALGMVACGGGGGGATTGTTAADHGSRPGSRSQAGISHREHRAASRRLARELGVSARRVKRLRSGQGLAATSVRPGEIVPGGPGPFFSSDVISIRNGWQASDHRSYTAVEAGVNPADRSEGELGIFRQHFVKATQTQHLVKVPDAGALKITDAPLGRPVATWAQRRGNLRFAGARGVRGTLHLRTDEVTIERRG